MLNSIALPKEGEPITLEKAIDILADGRPIRRSLRRACIEEIRKAQFRLRAFEDLYAKAGNI